MTQKYKSSYKSPRGVNRFRIEFSGTPSPEPKRPCSLCGGEVEAAPMLSGVCYDCYRNVVTIELQPDPRLIMDAWQVTAQAEHGEWLDEIQTRESDYPQ